MEKSISVIIPIFNAAPFLEQCLDSILAQNHDQLEILCLNDGSTDESLQIMEGYAKRDPRVRVISKENEGYGATCNRGLSEAHGYWISIIEPDDWIEAGMYTTMITRAESSCETPDIVKTPYWRIIDPDTPKQKRINCSYRGRVPADRLFTASEGIHLLQHHPSIWSAIYRREFLEEHGIRFMPIPGAGWADNPFLMETMVQAKRIAYLDRPFYCYREETEEKSRNMALKSTLLPLQRWQDMKDILERLNVDDKAINRALIRRGFTYLSGIYRYVSLEDEELAEAAKAMFARMDPKLVFSDDDIPPFDRCLFAKLMNLPEPKIDKLAYAGSLFWKGLYFLTNTGFSYTLTMVRNVSDTQARGTKG